MHFLLRMVVFHGYVSLPEGNPPFFCLPNNSFSSPLRPRQTPLLIGVLNGAMVFMAASWPQPVKQGSAFSGFSVVLGGETSKICYFHSENWEDEPNLTSIFFRWVETTN